MSRYVGLVLAGGRGERAGRAKGGVVVNGRSLAERAADVLAPLCDEVLISVAPGMANPAPSHRRVDDFPPAGRGPLAGIDAAFRGTVGVDLIVLACDYPNVDTELMEAVARAAGPGTDVAMAASPDGREHPLVAVWRRAVSDAVAAAVGDGRLTVRALVDALRVRRVGTAELPGFDLRSALINVNSRDELESLLGTGGKAERGGADGAVEPPGPEG